jgi:4-diphosphocytidyl-2-C-methyl-D-erythritol kinase
VTEFSPAKLNLFLAVTGRRPDGYHDLLSVATPLRWGDELAAEVAAGVADTLACDDPAVPGDASNLILRAAAAFRAAGGTAPPLAFSLTKRIPMGAGLGGGSSNAVAALRLLQRASDRPLPSAALAAVAAGIGADCSLFLAPGPVVMRGRGEQIAALPAEAERRLVGRRAYLFKPGFSVATAWAYARLRDHPEGMLPPAAAEARLQQWTEAAGAPADALLFNQLEIPVFAKYPALPVLLDVLRQRFGLNARMSGSGSACFCLLPNAGGPSSADLTSAVHQAWGPSAFTAEVLLG